MKKTKIKALLLLSGGLDSILAAKLLLEQGIEILAINFRTNFCGPSKARPAAEMLGVSLGVTLGAEAPSAARGGGETASAALPSAVGVGGTVGSTAGVGAPTPSDLLSVILSVIATSD